MTPNLYLLGFTVVATIAAVAWVLVEPHVWARHDAKHRFDLDGIHPPTPPSDSYPATADSKHPIVTESQLAQEATQ